MGLLEELTNVPSEYDWTSLPLGHAKMPVFVTWYKRSIKKKYDELRGCLGTFSQELPIGIGLKKYSIMSALNDKRFDPISISEIGSLKCSISLLHSFNRAKSWNDWELEKHGITIHFTDSSSSKKQYNATYLPEVPGQQKWNKLVTIENLVNKAGFNGNASKVKNLSVTRYESCKYTMSWKEYLNYSKLYKILKKKICFLQTITTPQIYNVIINNDHSFYVNHNQKKIKNKNKKNGMKNGNINDEEEEEENVNNINQRTKYKSNMKKPNHSIYRNHHNYHHHNS